VVTFLRRPGQGASQVENLPRFNWATQFWRWHTMVQVPLIFLSEWREFPSKTCLAGKKTWQLVSRCRWKSARRLTCLLSSPVIRNDYLQFVREQTALSNDTIDFVLRYRELGRAKNLSAPLVHIYWSNV
jgi:hypothetical protein